MPAANLDCPCGYGKGLAADTLVCPICGLDQSPLRNLDRTVSAVSSRVMWAGIVMFCVGAFAALFGVAGFRVVSHSGQSASTYVSPPEHQPATKVSQPVESHTRSLTDTAVVRYIVSSGDSWWKIAAVHYGNGAFWRQVADVQGNGHVKALVPGQTLELRTITVVPKVVK